MESPGDFFKDKNEFGPTSLLVDIGLGVSLIPPETSLTIPLLMSPPFRRVDPLATLFRPVGNDGDFDPTIVLLFSDGASSLSAELGTTAPFKDLFNEDGNEEDFSTFAGELSDAPTFVKGVSPVGDSTNPGDFDAPIPTLFDSMPGESTGDFFSDKNEFGPTSLPVSFGLGVSLIFSRIVSPATFPTKPTFVLAPLMGTGPFDNLFRPVRNDAVFNPTTVLVLFDAESPLA
mmetsp:Transcript_19494/g.40359  ORF Transcript_19494/g.40359 Transcript_19494/m.40359 type:complete len:231 (-) Transcript_19494:760-1452(-)